MIRSPHRWLSAALLVAWLGIGLSVAGAASPVDAHSGQLMSWGRDETGAAIVDGFTTLSTTDASMAFLGATVPFTDYTSWAIEICNEDAWAVGELGNSGPVLLRWDHDTGAFGASVPLVADITPFFPGALTAKVDFVWEADSTVGCDGYVIAAYSFTTAAGPGSSLQVLSSIDLTTGLVSPIVAGPDAIATDPFTGVTVGIYLIPTPGGIPGPTGIPTTPYFGPVDLTGATGGFLSQMAGLYSLLGDAAAPLEADFDSTGRLWIGYTQLVTGDYHLVSFPAGSDLATATPTDVGVVTTSAAIAPHRTDRGRGLAFDPFPPAPPPPGPAAGGPILPATGASPGITVVLGVTILLAGVVLIPRRRSRHRSRLPESGAGEAL